VTSDEQERVTSRLGVEQNGHRRMARCAESPPRGAGSDAQGGRDRDPRGHGPPASSLDDDLQRSLPRRICTDARSSPPIRHLIADQVLPERV